MCPLDAPEPRAERKDGRSHYREHCRSEVDGIDYYKVARRLTSFAEQAQANARAPAGGFSSIPSGGGSSAGNKHSGKDHNSSSTNNAKSSKTTESDNKHHRRPRCRQSMQLRRAAAGFAVVHVEPNEVSSSKNSNILHLYYGYEDGHFSCSLFHNNSTFNQSIVFDQLNRQIRIYFHLKLGYIQVFTSCVTISNPDSLSSSERGVNPGITSLEKHLSE